MFWISYDPTLRGYGDQMMAQKLSKRIQSLGYRSIVFPKGKLPVIDEMTSPHALIHVPDGMPELPHYPIRFTVLQECGYNLQKGPALGLRLRKDLEEVSISPRGSDRNSEVFSETEDDYEGLLLDEELMSLYQSDPMKPEEVRAREYSKISRELRIQIDPIFGLTLESSLSEIASQLKKSDLYFGYSQSLFSKQYFSHLVEMISLSEKKRPVVILSGGDFLERVRSLNQRRSKLQGFISKVYADDDGCGASLSEDFFEKLSFGDSSEGIIKDGVDFLDEAIPSQLGDEHAGSTVVLEQDQSSVKDFFSPYFKTTRSRMDTISDPFLFVLPQKISHSDFKILLYLSSFSLTTGDRSVEEAISAGVPFLYEVLEHKIDFSDQLLRASPKGVISQVDYYDSYSQETLQVYGDFRSSGKLRTADFQVEWIIRALRNIKNPESVDYFNFFKKLQDQSFFNNDLLKKFLEGIFDREVIFPGLPEDTFILGQVYQVTLDDIIEIGISTDTGQSKRVDIINKYKLSSKHAFKYRSLGNGKWIISLERN